MKKLLLVLAALSLTTGGAFAATAKATPPTAAQKAEFLRLCLKNSDGNTTLCTCKAEQAMKLIDTDFMAVVIGQMSGKLTLTKEQEKPYAIYVSRSNKVCAPGM